MLGCPTKSQHWVEFTLCEGTTPLASEPYRIKLADSRTVEGQLDANGRVRIETIAVEGKCTIQFPAQDKKRGGKVGHIPTGSAAYIPGKAAEGRTDKAWTLVLPEWDATAPVIGKAPPRKPKPATGKATASFQIHLDAAHLHGRPDRYLLHSTDGTYSQEKTLQHAVKSGKGTVRLTFEGLSEAHSYSLALDRGDGIKLNLFEAVGYRDLQGQE